MNGCSFCGKEGGQLSEGCLPYFIHDDVTDENYPCVRVGDEEDSKINGDIAECPSCGAAKGTAHHSGCELELCPVCGSRIIACGHASGDDDMYMVRDYSCLHQPPPRKNVHCCRNCKHGHWKKDEFGSIMHWWCGLTEDENFDAGGPDGLKHCDYWEKEDEDL